MHLSLFIMLSSLHPLHFYLAFVSSLMETFRGEESEVADFMALYFCFCQALHDVAEFIIKCINKMHFKSQVRPLSVT